MSTLWLQPAAADIILYTIPRTDATVVLQGKSTVNPGKTVTFRHPRFGTLYFSLDNVRINEAPTTEALAMRRISRAQRDDDAGQMMEAARWALYHGLLKLFYEGVEKTLALDPNHPDARLVMELKRHIDQPLDDSSQQEQELRDLVGRTDMRLQMSNHFIMLHDTPADPGDLRKRSRADERLELLETVYESFLLRFYSQGLQLEIPRQRLKVVLFNDHRDYLDFATRLSPSLRMAAGFYTKTANVSVFYDQGSDESFAAVKTLAELLQAAKRASLENVDSRTSTSSSATRSLPMPNPITPRCTVMARRGR